MENIFFNTDYNTFGQTLVKVLLFLAFSGALVYIIFFVFSKLLFRKSKQRKSIIIMIIFLCSLVGFFILFNVYIFILFFVNGIDNMDFTSGRFYLGIISQILIYIVLIVFFFVKRYTLIKIINKNTLI